jgi:hypothetical protein
VVRAGVRRDFGGSWKTGGARPTGMGDPGSLPGTLATVSASDRFSAFGQQAAKKHHLGAGHRYKASAKLINCCSAALSTVHLSKQRPACPMCLSRPKQEAPVAIRSLLGNLPSLDEKQVPVARRFFTESQAPPSYTLVKACRGWARPDAVFSFVSEGPICRPNC